MRTAALILIAISELLILLLLKLDLSAASLSMLSTLLVVVTFAFTTSALIRNIKSIRIGRNYLFSGIIGVIVGIIFYLWAGENLESTVLWLENSGIDLMLIIIFVAALFLYFNQKRKEKLYGDA